MPKVRKRNVGKRTTRLTKQSIVVEKQTQVLPEENSQEVESILKNSHICCPKRKDRARLHHKICEDKCAHKNDCLNYRSWFKETFGEDLPRPAKKIRKKKGVKTREDAQKQEERLASQEEAYKILGRTLL
jgi:hypothetical protein